ncbi:MAG TPA: ABC transporter ATP-binding protein [Bacteroidota bacterium]
MSDASSTVIRTDGLSKRYGRRWAVQDLSLEVHRGEVFGFLGPNGAGKSTTIRMMLSLVRPTGGFVELFGDRVDRRRASALRRVGGLVERADFYGYLTARRNLEIVGTLYGGVPPGAVDRALVTVGLADRGNDRVKTFSHGMKQRLGIAQALLSAPELVILDEPTTGLDPQGIVEVRELITSLARDHGITVFLSSHLLGEIEQTAASMAIIHHGKLVVQGPVRELLSSAQMTVTLDARPLERARSVLSRLTFIQDVKEQAGLLILTMDSKDVPALARALVEDGVEVNALVPKRSLEEYFLSITSESAQ